MSKKKELQSLENAERKIEDYNILLATMEEQAKTQYEEKKQLEQEIANQKSLIIKIKWLLKINKYNNEKAILGKIKELVSDFHSQN